MKLNYKTEYITSTLVVLFSGILLNTIISYSLELSQLFVLGVVGSIVITLISSFWNLLYFLPLPGTAYNFLLPGILTLLTVLAAWWSSVTDVYFLGGIAIFNLLAGSVHYLRKRISKDKDNE
ncbi:MAG: hypothetical protein AAFO69_16165 [Bacteroidota bacterium]